MQVKKTPRADLQNRRVLFLEIGLVVSLAAVVLVFAFGRSKKTIPKIDMKIAPVEQEILYMPHREERPPEVKPQPPVVLSGFIDIVKNETEIAPDYEPDDADDEPLIEIPAVEEEEVEDVPVYVAEEMPSFMGGGLNAFRSWVNSQLIYPQAVWSKGIQGLVRFKFVIEKDGSLTNPEELESADRLLAEEVLRVLKLSPKWSPGKERGEPVRVYFIFPIEFMIQN